MKLGNIITIVSFLCSGAKLLGQSEGHAPQGIPFLDSDSQSNIAVTVNALRRNPQPPPPRYTNVISNTNLFSINDQKLLNEIPLKYKSVTTNSGPPGTVFVSLNNSTNGLVACFQYTNSDAHEEITFSGMRSARFRTGSGDGYDVDTDIRTGSVLNFREFKHDVMDGLFVSFYGDHCASWMRFAKGKAVGKWLMWGAGNTLLIDAEFKEPYDFFKHARQIRK